MNFIERITGTITSPDKTMADVCKEPRWEEALVIVGLLAILSAIYGYLQGTHMVFTGSVQGMDASMMNTITLITTVVSGLIMPVIVWIVATVVLFLIAMALGGDGKFSSLLTGIGYSFIVKIFFTIIAMLVLTQAPYVTIEYTQSTTDMLAAQAPYTSSIFVLASNAILLIGLLWSCWIGILALKHCQKLSMKSAAIAVIIPLVLYLIITYGMMFVTMML